MPQLTHRDYTGGADRDAALALWLSVRAAGQGDPWPALHMLHAALNEAARAPGSAHLWAADQGDLIAAALLLEESVLVWAVRPGSDDEAIEAAIIGWGLARAAGAGLFVPVRDDDWRLAGLLEQIGFQEENWRILRMERSLLAPLALPNLPAGDLIRPLDAPRDLATVTHLHGAIFAGGGKRVAERRKLMAAPGYRPALDLVAVTPAGDLVGYCLGTVCALERRRLAWAPGWLELIGVAELWRGQGLGQALTLAMLAAMRAEGLISVLLSVSATNHTAYSLFERCGFRTRHSIRWYFTTGKLGRMGGLRPAQVGLRQL